MPERNLGQSVHRLHRRWTFATCTFDESKWQLCVEDKPVHIEAKPLELLRALLLRPGEAVSKDELLDAIWPDVTVVEASLPTAVHKLRVALRDFEPLAPIIETLSGIGYRLVAPVMVEDLQREVASRAISARSRAEHPDSTWRDSFGKAIAMVSAAILVALISSSNPSISKAPLAYSQSDARNALRRLDVPAIEQMLAAGWDPNGATNRDGNGALHTVLEMCEWDPGHDRRRLMLMVRTLYEGGAKLDLRNKWGDTPYSIASARRYCGSDHPATKALYAACYLGSQSLSDRCKASYQLGTRRR